MRTNGEHKVGRDSRLLIRLWDRNGRLVCRPGQSNEIFLRRIDRRRLLGLSDRTDGQVRGVLGCNEQFGFCWFRWVLLLLGIWWLVPVGVFRQGADEGKVVLGNESRYRCEIDCNLLVRLVFRGRRCVFLWSRRRGRMEAR